MKPVLTGGVESDVTSYVVSSRGASVEYISSKWDEEAARKKAAGGAKKAMMKSEKAKK